MAYSQREMNLMRQDAMRRSHEARNMQFDSAESISETSDLCGDSQKTPSSSSPNPAEDVPLSAQLQAIPKQVQKLLDGNADADLLLILLILWMLMREGGDKKLMLALCYILL